MQDSLPLFFSLLVICILNVVSFFSFHWLSITSTYDRIFLSPLALQDQSRIYWLDYSLLWNPHFFSTIGHSPATIDSYFHAMLATLSLSITFGAISAVIALMVPSEQHRLYQILTLSFLWLCFLSSFVCSLMSLILFGFHRLFYQQQNPCELLIPFKGLNCNANLGVGFWMSFLSTILLGLCCILFTFGKLCKFPWFKPSEEEEDQHQHREERRRRRRMRREDFVVGEYDTKYQDIPRPTTAYVI